MIKLKKLTLNRESLQRLSSEQEPLIHGGITYDGCGTNTCSTCLKFGCPGGPTGRCSAAPTACMTDRNCEVL